MNARVWGRLQGDGLCGLCRAQLKDGSPVQLVRLHMLKRILIRCPTCADGDVPPDLPAAIVRDHTHDPVAFTAFTQGTVMDFKRAASGE